MTSRPSTGSGHGLGAAALAVLLACAGPASGEKGRFAPLDLPRERVEAAHAPRRLALVVGVQRFDDPRWRPLRYAEADAAAVAAALRDPALGAFDEVEVLADAPTRATLRAALERLAARTRDERDTVLVYVSSHGTLARDAAGRLRRYLAVRDTRLDDVHGTGLALEEVEAAFDRLRSRRKVLVLATCHSGDGKSLLPDDVQAELAGIKSGFFPPPLEEVSRARLVLAASDFGETAREDERLGHDVYTHFLLEALHHGLDRNGDGAVTASEAHDHARRRTYEFTGGRQRPSAHSNEVGADAIVLAGRVSRTGRPELFSYAERLDGFTVRVDGESLAELPGGLALAPGRHRVQLVKGGGPELLDTTVRLLPGERVDVARLVNRAEGRWEAAPRAGVLSFLDEASRRDVMGTALGAGVALTVRDALAPGLSLRLDVTLAGGRSRLEAGAQTAPFEYQLVSAGAALPWRFSPRALRGAALIAGPRLSAVWLERRFDVALAPAAQSYLTVAPGVLVGVAVPAGRRVTLGAELQLDWTIVRVDGADRSTAFGALLAGVGWRF
jgi:hypothetical protein